MLSEKSKILDTLMDKGRRCFTACQILSLVSAASFIDAGLEHHEDILAGTVHHVRAQGAFAFYLLRLVLAFFRHSRCCIGSNYALIRLLIVVCGRADRAFTSDGCVELLEDGSRRRIFDPVQKLTWEHAVPGSLCVQYSVL